ncbi:hypothetical protein R3W88_026817 [Solanum pinnatisectum]|uniref:Glycine-rich protein n=1 Tax=Solanum pinnatisectum TaxID=50273 RepID=A0AAV9LEZ2_9SOLN|nr:hypothetical protein R3W88_026817 [Solanum pinnatisectum]
MRKPFAEIMQLIDEVTKNNRAWHTRETEVEDLGVTFELSAEQKEKRGRKGSGYGSYENPDGFTHEAYHRREGQYDRPANREQGTWQNRDGYRNDHSGVYVPQGNRNRASGSSSGSKLEDMLAKVLQKVESTDAGLKEMKGDFSNMSQL